MQSKPLLPAILLFCSVVGLSSVVQAQRRTVDCEDNSVQARCPESSCHSSNMRMKCNNGNEGYVRSDTRLDYLRVLVTSINRDSQFRFNPRHFTLQNPEGGIGDYESVNRNYWVEDEINKILESRGRAVLGRGDRIEVARNGYGIKDDTPLYRNENLTTQIGTVGGNSRNSEQRFHTCEYTEPTKVVISNSCGKRVCLARARCKDRENGDHKSLVNLFCHATSYRGLTYCPSADDCAVDSDVDMPYLDDLREKEEYERLRPQSGGRSNSGVR